MLNDVSLDVLKLRIDENVELLEDLEKQCHDVQIWKSLAKPIANCVIALRRELFEKIPWDASTLVNMKLSITMNVNVLKNLIIGVKMVVT